MPRHVIRHHVNGAHKWGVLFGTSIASLGTVANSTEQPLREHWDRIWSLDSSQATLPRDRVQLLAPVTTGQQFICQGFNYRSHVEESGLKLSDFPFNTIRTDDGAVDLGEQTTSITDDIPMEVRRAA